ncbi:MAG TPA: 4-(cytidine 5'-diphospho)-2-C-methyl-D-erythritol kinase, partial [Acidimicrobiales bacterium]|nr:4-(cytidine 5'-diphospho)-2-C-methyl-D-erythritol kinase [Acidimicrobiales bacterium]
MEVQFARAKLTLSLRVVGVRDDGYHLLDAEMVTLDLADTLLFGAGDGIELIPLVDTVRFEPSLVTDALAAVGRRSFVRLEKRIPVGAGLGGGS